MLQQVPVPSGVQGKPGIAQIVAQWLRPDQVGFDFPYVQDMAVLPSLAGGSPTSLAISEGGVMAFCRRDVSF